MLKQHLLTERIVRLVKQVVSVSVETARIVGALPKLEPVAAPPA